MLVDLQTGFFVTLLAANPHDYEADQNGYEQNHEENDDEGNADA
jgi:hypothetical protein